MSKGKLAKFADMASYPHVFEYPFSVVEDVPFALKGQWREQFFKNQNPIVLELGCGRGEYAVGLARRYPDRNFIGVDIKGARMWSGATESLRDGLTNVAFLRTNIEIIDHFFAPGEVQEIWLTFSDPQMKKATKRLTSTYFLQRYRHFLTDGGLIHLKTDSNFLFTYTKYVVEENHLPMEVCTEDLYRPTPSQTHPLTSPCEERGELPLTAERKSACLIHSAPLSHRVAREEEVDLMSSSPSDPGLTPKPRTDWQGGESDGSLDLSIRTYYEQQWLDRGLSIKYLRFRLPAEGELHEPDVEIPLDDYRSYNREKRSSLKTSK